MADKIWERNNRRYNFVRIWGKRYAHMKARTEGRSTNKSNAAKCGMMSQAEFFAWCCEFDNLSAFLALYYDWAAAGFPLSLSPSIDRIEPDKGYLPHNIQWMAFAENCSKNNIHPITHKRLVL